MHPNKRLEESMSATARICRRAAATLARLSPADLEARKRRAFMRFQVKTTRRAEVMRPGRQHAGCPDCSALARWDKALQCLVQEHACSRRLMEIVT